MSRQDLKTMLLSVQDEKKTGKVVVLGKEGINSRIGNLIFDQGELMNATYPTLSGNEALNAILALDISQVRFLQFPECPESLHPGMRSMSELLATLTEDADAAKQKISDEQKVILLQVLSTVIGPVAQVIGPSVLASASDVDTAITAMAAEISDQNRAAKFISEVRRRLTSES